MKSIAALEKQLATPSDRLVSDLQHLSGDIMILGVGGKMGPSLAKLCKNAFQEIDHDQNVIGVSRFSYAGLQEDLENYGIETIAADLLKPNELEALPEVENIIYMIGKKFGTLNNESLTWAINTYLPGLVAEKFKNSRIVVFSSGNVYPFVSHQSGGATENTPPEPVGEYAQSCLGRERIFEHFSKINSTPMLIYRLNYAVEMRYGNVLEIAQAIYNSDPVDLRNGHMNVIWQGDANEMALRSLLHCSTPPKILNVTGPETISVRSLAHTFGDIFKKTPQFMSEEKDTALLNNASQAHKLFGYPQVPLNQIIEWTAAWVQQDGKTIDKPTHFQLRSGKF